jgi:threonine dehydrogenase-like Zn-dependent dehydrogenase
MINGALAEPVAVAVRAVRLSGASIGDSALVIGAGPTGVFATKLLSLSGVEVFVSEINKDRLRWAKEFGASRLIEGGDDNVLSEIKREFPEGVDVVIDAVGSEETRKLAINAVRRGGKVILSGLHENEVKIPGNLIVRNEIEIKGSFVYTDEDFRKAVRLLEKGLINTGSGWLDIRPLEKGQESFEELAEGSTKYVKIMLTPGE